MRNTEKWYPNLTVLLGTDYRPLIDVEKPRVWKHVVKPKIRKYTFEGQNLVSMMWSTLDGNETSASPAHQHNFVEAETEIAGIVKNMTESCNLPGLASDYHQVLQQAHESLFKQRKTNPEVYKLIEDICLLDIMLVERFTTEIFDDRDFYWVVAFKRLSDLYQKEGRFSEALSIMQRAIPFGLASEEDVSTLQEVINGL